MPSHHNLYPQFKTLKRPVSLRLGTPATPPPGGTAETDFELDAPGIDFGEDTARIVETVVTTLLTPNNLSDGSPDASDEMENN